MNRVTRVSFTAGSRVTWILVAGDDEQSHLGFFAAGEKSSWISVAGDEQSHLLFLLLLNRVTISCWWRVKSLGFFTAGEQDYLDFSCLW